MTYTPYIDGNGSPKNRKVRGDGSQTNPHEGYVVDADLHTVTGTQSDAGLSSPVTAGSLVSIIKGFWTSFGLTSQSSDTTGTLMQRVRAIVDRVGSYGDAANATGSIMAQLRMIAESYVLPRAHNGQYYASFLGGNKSYNATAGVQAVTSAGGLISIFQNPAGSGVDLYVQRLVMSGDQPGRFERYRGGTVTVGTAAVGNNRGGNGTVGIGKVYGRSGASATGGNLGVITYIPASGTYGDMVDGTLILRPGQVVYWMYFPNTGVAGSSNCAVEVVWWELPAQA